ncbi:MAG: OmpL47-type beta-barrel domain-containing protein [Thermoplasmatota archaeon]
MGRSYVTLGAVALGALAAFVLLASHGLASTQVPATSYTTSQTWTLAGSPYIVTGNVVVYNQATLTIQAGVRVEMGPGVSIQIGDGNVQGCCGNQGRLIVQGNASHPVVIEGTSASNPAYGLVFEGYNSASLGSNLANLTMRNVTYGVVAYQWSALTADNLTVTTPVGDGAYLAQSSPTFENSTFVAGAYGVFGTDYQSQPTVERTSFANQTAKPVMVGVASQLLAGNTYGNAAQRIGLWGGNVTYGSTITIRPQAIPYELDQWFAINSQQALTIDPGVHIYARSDAFMQIGNGNAQGCCGNQARLNALGTGAAPITIEALSGNASRAGYAGAIIFQGPNGAALSSVARNVTFRNQQYYGIYENQWSALTVDNASFANPGGEGIELLASSPTIEDSHFDGGSYGVSGTDWQSAPTVFGSSFANQTTRYAAVGVTAPFLGGNTFSGTGSRVSLWGGNVTYGGAMTIHAIPVPYELDQWFAINNQQRLTIQAGVHILARSDSYMQIGSGNVQGCCGNQASVQALGTVAQPITIEALTHSNSNGGYAGAFVFEGPNGAALSSVLRNVTLQNQQYYGVYLNQWSTASLDNVTIANPGSYGVELIQSSPTIKDSHFVGALYGVFSTNSQSTPTISGTSFANQTVRYALLGVTSALLGGNSYSGTGTYVTLLGGNTSYSSSFTIYDQPVSYELDQWFIVLNQQTLRIQPGVHIYARSDAYIQIGNGNAQGCCGNQASVQALGTVAQPITIEPLSGLNSNGGYAGAFVFQGPNGAALQSALRNVTLRNQQYYGVYLNQWSPIVLDNVTIANPGSYGVELVQSSPTIKGSHFVGASYGVFSANYLSTPTISGTTFTNQTARYGIVGVTSVLLGGNAYSGTGTYMTLLGGNTSYGSSFTIYDQPVSYELDQYFIVLNQQTLRIQPGVHIYARSDAYIQIGNGNVQGCCGNQASVQALGTVAEPITIESLSGANSNAGYAGAFVFQGPNGAALPSALRNVTLRDQQYYGAYLNQWNPLTLDNVSVVHPLGEGVSLAQSSPTIKDSHFVGGQYGVYSTDFRSAPTVSGTSFAGQAVRYATMGVTSSLLGGNSYAGTGSFVELWGGNTSYASSFTINRQPVSYELDQWFTVYNQQTLTIQPGVHIYARSDAYIQIGTGNVQGCCGNQAFFNAAGTASNPIVIDSLSGSNANGAGWQGIRFEGSNGAQNLGSTIRNVTLLNVAGDAIDLYAWNSFPLDHVDIERASHDGIFFGSSSGHTVSNSTFRHNGAAGVSLDAASTGNTLYNNLFLNTVGAPTAANAIDAGGNKWAVTPRLGPNICRGLKIGGNAWDDYLGTDADRDGIGDTNLPYTNHLGSATDPSPLFCPAPLANFSVGLPLPALNRTATFLDNSTATTGVSLVNWTWNFSDGTPLVYGPNPLHTFAHDGVYVVYETVRDELGHVTTTNRTIVVDVTPPLTTATLSGTAGGGGWYTTPVRVSLSAVDTFSTTTRYVAPGNGSFETYLGPFNVTAEGHDSVSFYSVDAYGNREATKATTFSIDQIPPVTVATIHGPTGTGGWYQGPVTVSLDATDDASGIASTSYSLDGGAFVPYLSPIPVAANGTHNLTFASVDVAGNAEAPHTIGFAIDAGVPTTHILPTGTAGGALGGALQYRTAVSVAFPTNATTSGIFETLFRVNGGNWTRWDGNPVTFAAQGVYDVESYSVSGAGLAGPVVSLNFGIDLTPPTAPTIAPLGTAGLSLPDGTPTFRTNLTVVLNASDIGANGLAGPVSVSYQICSSCDGVPWQVYGQPFALQGEGEFQIHARATDIAGNTAFRSTSVLIDLTAPLVNFHLDSHAVTSGGRLFVRSSLCFRAPLGDLLTDPGVDASPVVSGVNSVFYVIVDDANRTVRQFSGTVDSLSNVTGTTANLSVGFCETSIRDGNYTLHIGSCDYAGNCGYYCVDCGGGGALNLWRGGIRFGVDTTPPTVSIVWPPPGTINLDNLTLPLLPTAAECEAAYARSPLIAPAVDAACLAASGPLANATATSPGLRDTLRNETILAGRVPVLVQAADAGSGLGTVVLLVNGTPIADASGPLPGGYFLFQVDTVALAGLGHTDTNVPVEAIAVDQLGNGAGSARTMTLVGLEPSMQAVAQTGLVGMQPPAPTDGSAATPLPTASAPVIGGTVALPGPTPGVLCYPLATDSGAESVVMAPVAEALRGAPGRPVLLP